MDRGKDLYAMFSCFYCINVRLEKLVRSIANSFGLQ